MIFNFSFDANETNLILQALGELPAKISFSMLNKIHAELQKQGEMQINADKNNKITPIKQEDKK